MITNTVDALPVFVVHEPDWSKPVRVWQSWQTDIHTARSGFEQRANRRSEPLWSIAYARTFQDASWSVRRAEMLAEFAAPLVIPLWPLSAMATDITGDEVTLDVGSMGTGAFKAGSYAYFEEAGLDSVFRKIAVVGESSITLEAGDAAHPEIAVPEYETPEVWPCILGMRSENRGQWQHSQHAVAEEVIHVEEL